MLGRRCMARQNGCRPLTYAIFVCMGVLLLYGPYVARADVPDVCEALQLILDIPQEVNCYSGQKLVYNELPQDHIGPIYNLTALDNITFKTLTPGGTPPDEYFNEYFSASIEDENTISLKNNKSLEDFGDYFEDITTNTATSSNYILTFQNGSEQKNIEISKFQFMIEDVNNKPPEFGKETYNKSLREDWPVDFQIPDLMVDVKDGDRTAKSLQLSFDDSCPLDTTYESSIVMIPDEHQLSITFKLKAKLDHEVSPTVTCILTAVDDENVHESSTKIVITVEPGKDKPPKFDEMFYWIDVGAESPGDALNVLPAKINAEDQDDPPTNIIYSMENAKTGVNGKEYFEIDDSTAEIKLIKELGDDFLNDHNQLRFVIIATDELGDQDKAFLEINLPEPLTTTVMTTTETTPEPTTTAEPTTTPGVETTEPGTIVSDSTQTTTSGTTTAWITTTPGGGTTAATTTHEPSGPVFRKDTYLFQTLKDMVFIGTVKATIDGMVSADIEYSIEEGEDENDNFIINSQTGVIEREEDAELEAGSYELTVVAKANSMTSEPTLVKIVVMEDMDLSLSITNSLNEVRVPEEKPGATIGNVTYLGGKKNETLCVIHQEGVVNYNDIWFEFINNTLKLKEDYKLDRENMKLLRVWIQIFNSKVNCSSGHYMEEGPGELLRSQGLFVIEVDDENDNKPKFEYPKSDITIAYPEDPALQKVVGPVIQLRASDLDDSDNVHYTLDMEADNKFVVDGESGAVFWEGGDKLGTSCGGDNGCSFKVKAQDKGSDSSDPVTCTVVSLPQDKIYTLSFSNIALSEVEEKLEQLSQDIDMTVRALYVTPKPSTTTNRANYRKYLKIQHYIRDDVGGTPFNLDVHVSVLDKKGKIVSFDEFNGKLPDEAIEAELFKDKEIFNIEDTGNVFGYQIALGVTGGLMGILLLALVIMGIIRYRKRSERRRGPEVPKPRLQYGNQGYVNDDVKHHDAHDGNSIKMNGSVNSFHEPPREGRDSPPLNKSTLAASDTLPRGLRRTAPEHVPNLGQPASREPPSQFKESTQKQSQPPAAAAPVAATAPVTGAAVAARSAADQTPAKKQPTAEEPVITQAVDNSSYNTSSFQPRQKKEPPPLTAAPKKSALKGVGGTTSTDSQKTKDPQIPLISMAPTEPAADYETSPAKTATSSFSNLKASPPPKKKEEVQSKPDEDGKEEGDDKSTDRKKSNLKAMTDSDSNDQKDQDKRKNSVAFKVLVEQKTIEAQNEGPASKKQAESEAKAETNQAAVDIMEANKKKLEDDEDEDDNIKL